MAMAGMSAAVAARIAVGTTGSGRLARRGEADAGGDVDPARQPVTQSTRAAEKRAQTRGEERPAAVHDDGKDQEGRRQQRQLRPERRAGAEELWEESAVE